MALCQWSESMSVGESRLDADHKALIRLINRLHDSLEAGAEFAALGEVFDSLINYINFHFTREEKVMQACGYPHAEAHEEEHAGFTRHIKEVRDPYADVMPTSRSAAGNMYCRWQNPIKMPRR